LFERLPAPRFPRDFLHKRQITELAPRGRLRLRRAQSPRDVLLRLALDVEGQFLIELAFRATRREQRAHPQPNAPEIHDYASFITRPMAALIRSHSLASIASWRRPEGVSR
jgi:hypothetical protein